MALVEVPHHDDAAQQIAHDAGKARVIGDEVGGDAEEARGLVQSLLPKEAALHRIDRQKRRAAGILPL